MAIADDMWKKLKTLKLELLQLKQKKRASTTSKYYIYNLSGDTYYNIWEITYDNSTQPIVTEVLSYYNTALATPTGNTQLIFSFAQASAQMTVLSTRKIISVRGVRAL